MRGTAIPWWKAGGDFLRGLALGVYHRGWLMTDLVMRRTSWGASLRRAAASLSVVAGFSALVGCANPTGTLLIVQNQIPVVDATAGAAGKCTFSADSSDPSLSSGRFDVDLDQPYPYFLYPLIQNRLPSLVTSGGVQRNILTLTALRVSIKAPAGVDPQWDAGCPGSFDAPAAGVLNPDDTRAIRVEGFQRCHAQHLLQLIKDSVIPADVLQPVFFTLELTAIADRSGSEQKSNPFRFDVQVCAGCLQSMFPATPTCAGAPKPNPLHGNPCNIAQDQPPVLCCTDTSGALVCPAPDA